MEKEGGNGAGRKEEKRWNLGRFGWRRRAKEVRTRRYGTSVLKEGEKGGKRIRMAGKGRMEEKKVAQKKDGGGTKF